MFLKFKTMVCVYTYMYVYLHVYISVQFSRSVMSDSLWPHESQHTKPPCPSVQGTLKSLLQHHSSKASILRRSAFLHSPPLTSIHDHWKNHSLDKTDLCWQSNVSAFFAFTNIHLYISTTLNTVFSIISSYDCISSFIHKSHKSRRC